MTDITDGKNGELLFVGDPDTHSLKSDIWLKINLTRTHMKILKKNIPGRMKGKFQNPETLT